jgi:ferredoxin
MLSMLILEIRLHQVVQNAAFVEIEHKSRCDKCGYCYSCHLELLSEQLKKQQQ